MRTIRRVASTGRTVICTVHQPSIELFAQFDDLLLLQRGGWQVFFGPLGKGCRLLIAYLEALPGTPRCPAGFNPASWMLDVLSGSDSSGGGGDAPTAVLVKEGPDDHDGAGLSPVASPAAPAAAAGASAQGPAGEGLQAAYFSSQLWLGGDAGAKAVAPGGLAAALTELCAPAPGSVPLAFSSARARSPWTQLVALTRRQWLAYLRNIPFNIGRIVATLFLMVLFGIIYLRLAERAGDLAGVQSLVAAIFMTVGAWGGRGAAALTGALPSAPAPPARLLSVQPSAPCSTWTRRCRR